MKKKFRLLTIGLICLQLVLFTTHNSHASMDLIDTPTAETLDYYAMETKFRLYSAGGMVSRLNFGVLKMLNIGCSWDVDKLIGREDPEPRPPYLSLKVRVYDGSRTFPAFSIGYDGQGYDYNESSDTYLSKGKGIYFVGDMEVFLDNLQFHLGTNISFDEEKNKTKANLFGFVGVDYSFVDNEEKIVTLMTEYDNLFKHADETRLNAGIRMFITPSLNIEFSFRDIASPRKFDTERSISINYQTEF